MMSECQHEFILTDISGPRYWPRICKHCNAWELDIKVATLKVERDELLAACEATYREIDTVTSMGRECPFCGHTFNHDDVCLYEKLETAIAKAKGKADAAASDAVAACNSLVIAVDYLRIVMGSGCPFCDGCDTHEPTCPYAMAKAAIAKAKGEDDD